MLGGAPSMFLCLEDIESASFMFHLCPRGSNEADSMYLRHKNRDSVFLKNIMSYFGKIYNLTPYRESSFFWILEVGRKTILTSFHRKKSDPLLSILPRGGGQLGKDGFVMLIAKWRDRENAKMQKGRFLEIYTIRGRGKMGNCVCIVNFAPDLGKPAFLILRNENMRVPWPGDCARNSKLKNVGFWLSPHFADFLYINSRYTAMAAWYY